MIKKFNSDISRVKAEDQEKSSDDNIYRKIATLAVLVLIAICFAMLDLWRFLRYPEDWTLIVGEFLSRGMILYGLIVCEMVRS
jgi:hypothetical protein